MTEVFASGYALLIGVDQNYIDAWALPGVAKDVEALYSVLTHPERCAYSAEKVKLITGEAATRQGILDGLEWLQRSIETDKSDNETAVIYYSGHGMPYPIDDPREYYLVPYDLRRGQEVLRALRATDFRQAIDVMNPKRLLVVLDCCHAAAMGVKGPMPAPKAVPVALFMGREEAAIGPPAKGARAAFDLAALTKGRGRAVLSSSTGNQSSYIRKDRTMSIFTYHLIEALTGHAQPQEGAVEVLVSDVMSHVWRKVPQSAMDDWGEDQQPDFQISGNFSIALLLGGKGLGKGARAPDPMSLFEGVGRPTTSVTIDSGGGDIRIVRGSISNLGPDTIGVIAGGSASVTKVSAPSGSAAGQAALYSLLDDLDRNLEALDLPEPEKGDAAYNLEQVKEALTKAEGPPDVRKLRSAVDWLAHYVPGLMGALTELFAHRVVRRTVASAGDAAAEWLRERFGGRSHDQP